MATTIDNGFFATVSNQQNVFFVNGLYWVFYYETGKPPNEVGYKTSSDGASWSAYTMAIANVGGGQEEVDFVVVGTTIYYATCLGNYRYGNLDVAGTITWAIPETSIGFPAYDYPSIAVDSGGFIYIATLGTNVVNVYTNRTGSWTLDLTVPFVSVPGARYKIVALTGGKMLLVYGDFNPSTWYTQRFDGANWSAGSNTVSNEYDMIYSEFTSSGDVAYGSAVRESGGSIVGIDFVKYDYNTDTWSATVIDTGQTYPSTILINSSNTLLITYATTSGPISYTFSNNYGASWTPIATIAVSPSPFDLTAILTNANEFSVVFDDQISIYITPDPPILITTAIIITDYAYAEDSISINRGTLPVCGMTSGAYPLSPMEKDYINLGYQQIIDISGLPITYKTMNIIGEDAYEHPIITYTNKTITAFITILRNDEYEYVEPGFLPNHYASMWVYCVTPQVGDHVVWQGIEWEVRNSIPKVIGNDTVYYQTVLRRVLARVPLTGEVGDGTDLGDTTGSGGTLQSGGVQYPPEGDP
jgi:hypothetical protein